MERHFEPALRESKEGFVICKMVFHTPKSLAMYNEIKRCEGIYQRIRKEQMTKAVFPHIPVAGLVDIVHGYWDSEEFEDRETESVDMLEQQRRKLLYARPLVSLAWHMIK